MLSFETSTPQKMWLQLDYLVVSSAIGFMLTWKLIPSFKEIFIKANLYGVDMSKKTKNQIPEAAGAIVGCIFLVITFLMIPLTFSDYILHGESEGKKDAFPHAEFAQLLAALLTIVCTLLIGFADDVLNLKWRQKLPLQTLAAMPLLVVYFVTSNKTEIVVPLLLRPFVGTHINLGILYYIYMWMLAVFCTNAVNILAGINGLEVGQSLVIAVSVITFNLGGINGELGHYHRLSLYFLLPFVGTSLPLLWYNWYPSRVFCGDTFCYFSGMTLAVVAILGHFSKTLLLFFVPQVFNFLLSIPQIFHLIPCPRHRLPKYNVDTDKVEMSKAYFKKSDMKYLGRISLKIFNMLGLVFVVESRRDETDYIECSNLTIINLMLKLFGPMHERNLTILLLSIQVFFSGLAFFIRYPLALLFYGQVVA